MTRDSINGERGFEKLLKDAREYLAEKLRSGEKVDGLDLNDLLECGLNSDAYKVIVDDVAAALWSEDKLIREQANTRLTNRLIDSYLDSPKEADFIRETAEEMAVTP